MIAVSRLSVSRLLLNQAEPDSHPDFLGCLSAGNDAYLYVELAMFTALPR